MGVRANQVVVGALAAAGSLLLCLPGAAAAAPGERDPTFGGNGVVKVNADPAAPNSEDRIEIDPAGRYVVLATTAAGTSRVLRFQRDGAIDEGFGSGGSVAAPEGTWRDLVLQADGAIVLAGTSRHDFAVARLTPAGQLDPTFGEGGTTAIDIGPQGPVAANHAVEESFESVRLAADGRVVALGNVNICSTEGERECLPDGSAIARFTAAGAPDPSFGNGGIFFFNPKPPRVWHRSGALNSLAIQPDGRVLAGGTFADHMIVIRLTETGVLDSSFSEDGRVRSPYDTVGGEEEVIQPGDARAILLQGSNRIVAVGVEVLLALEPDGSVDRSFGGKNHNGLAPIPNIATTRLDLDTTEAAVDGDGRILVAGDTNYLSAVARFYPNGAHDPRFAGDGLAHVNLSKIYFDPLTPEEQATDLAVEPDGAPVTAGFAFTTKTQARLTLTRWRGGDGRRARCHGRPATLQGTKEDDRLSASGVIVGFGGRDEIRGNWALICAGNGDDEVTSGVLSRIYGGAGDDRITASASSPSYGGAGDDVIVARRGNDHGDVFLGGPGDDLLVGGRGPDRLFGGPGRDQLIGGRGDDRLFGGPGLDRESGEGGGGRKIVYEGRGRDGFRIKLVVRRNRISTIHLRARMHCNNSDVYETSFDMNRVGVRIHPNGRFRYASTLDTSISSSERLLAGRVTREKIVGVYEDWQRGDGYCELKKRFVARRGS